MTATISVIEARERPQRYREKKPLKIKKTPLSPVSFGDAISLVMFAKRENICRFCSLHA